ncbi:MAG: hypothetical protein ABIR36_00420 [Nitrospiraceae bacterium]
MAYRQGPLLSSISFTHAMASLWSIARMNIGLMGIIYRAGKRFLLIEPDGFLMVVGYGRVCGFCFGSEANEARAAERVTARRRFVAGC